MSYKYQPLKPDHNGNPRIRVIHLMPSENVDDLLTCRIVHATLHDNSYSALSYTWGERVFSKTLVVNECTRIYITENLNFALRRLRLAGILTLWVDAICINQQDVQERAQQIRLMGRIFSQAKRVLVWTGLDNASRDGRHCLEHLARLSESRLSFSYDKRFKPYIIDLISDASPDRQTRGPPSRDTCDANAAIDHEKLQKFDTNQRKNFSQRWRLSGAEASRGGDGSSHLFNNSAQGAHPGFRNDDREYIRSYQSRQRELAEQTSKQDYDMIS